MFNKRLKFEVEQLNQRISHVNSEACDKYWSLQHDLDRLVEALGLSKRETHKIEYVKKGGPER